MQTAVDEEVVRRGVVTSIEKGIITHCPRITEGNVSNLNFDLKNRISAHSDRKQSVTSASNELHRLLHSSDSPRSSLTLPIDRPADDQRKNNACPPSNVSDGLQASASSPEMKNLYSPLVIRCMHCRYPRRFSNARRAGRSFDRNRHSTTISTCTLDFVHSSANYAIKPFADVRTCECTHTMFTRKANSSAAYADSLRITRADWEFTLNRRTRNHAYVICAAIDAVSRVVWRIISSTNTRFYLILQTFARYAVLHSRAKWTYGRISKTFTFRSLKFVSYAARWVPTYPSTGFT